MFTGQRIVGVQRMVELCIGPGGSRMANGAVAWQAKLHMRRVVALGEIAGMAGITLGRSALEYIIDVARCTTQRCMRSSERIARVFQVVKFGVEPTVHGVAGLAGSGELESDVIDNRREEIFLMAGEAVGGQARELAARRTFVALCALHHGMRANQRESVLMVLDRVDRYLPALD